MAQLEIRNHRAFLNGKAVPFRQTPNGGAPLTPVGIICHDTAGDLPGTGSVNWLTDTAAKASAHFVIGFDGSITQLQALNRQCWHAGASQYKGRQNCNGFTIGIEIANPGAMVKFGAGYSNGGAAKPEKGVKVPATMDVRKASSPHHGLAYWLAYSDAQIATVTALCRAIAAAYDIEFITTHWDICIPKGRKVDTNPLFPLEKLRADVLGRKVAAFMPQGDSDESDSTDISARRKEPDTAVVPVDAPADEQSDAIQNSAEADSETRPSWLRRKWKGVTGWLFGGGGAVGLGWLTDPWVVVAIGGILLLFVTLFIIWMGPGEVRAWIRKQVS